MEESTTYQYILEKGALTEARRTLLRLGTKKFGAPDAAVQAQLDNLSDLERFHDLEMRLLDVSTWQELLA
jgi:hypothetical protein